MEEISQQNCTLTAQACRYFGKILLAWINRQGKELLGTDFFFIKIKVNASKYKTNFKDEAMTKGRTEIAKFYKLDSRVMRGSLEIELSRKIRQ